MDKYTNALIKESSPYLLQHAHNPVNWISWSDEVFELAKNENKLILISVGYSACHWCHVMEHECFEDEEVAALMNKFFINVKVDREERPDVDQVYMTAVQLMTQKGGWPLNCFTLPNGSPIYGGTYFPKDQWMHILKSLQHTFQNEFDKVAEYASRLQEGVERSELIEKMNIVDAFIEEHLKELVHRWAKNFDLMNGGTSRAPKFPLPNNYEFLLEYSFQTNNSSIKDFVELSLDKMAMGGIYDQIGGGFSRYSVDMLWKVPHFEKMLYDNGQLISLYSNGYKIYRKPLYKRVVYQTIDWLEREMMDRNGAFYAALDADSEGEEGKFYVWDKKELSKLLVEDFEWAKELYQCNQRSEFENNYILLRQSSDEQIRKDKHWTEEDFEGNLSRANELLLDERNHRVRPALDDKCLTSWNAILLKGLCEAYISFDEKHFLHLALKNAKWMLKFQLKEDGGLWRTHKHGKSQINGFLEDFAHTISAFITLYEATFDEEWLLRAKELTNYTIDNFSDEKSGMFYFTSSDNKLIARKMEINDNVIPSSNSVMARNLFYLGKYFQISSFEKRARQMLANVYEGMEKYGSGYSNWAILLSHYVYGFYEVVVSGSDVTDDIKTLRNAKLPKFLLAKTNEKSVLPIFHNKNDKETKMFYLCTEGTCFAPTTDVKATLALFNNEP